MGQEGCKVACLYGATLSPRQEARNDCVPSQPYTPASPVSPPPFPPPPASGRGRVCGVLGPDACAAAHPLHVLGGEAPRMECWGLIVPVQMGGVPIGKGWGIVYARLWPGALVPRGFLWLALPGHVALGGTHRFPTAPPLDLPHPLATDILSVRRGLHRRLLFPGRGRRWVGGHHQQPALLPLDPHLPEQLQV